VQPWKVLSRKAILERHWLKVSEDRVLLPNGTVIDEFHVLQSPPWAAVVALTTEGQLILVEQYRHGLGGTSLELPAGVIDDGESPIAAAERELREETGFTAPHFHSLIELAPEPSRSTHRAHFFTAVGAHAAGRAEPEASEVVQVRLLSFEGALECIASGQIVHAAHVAALLLAERRGFFRQWSDSRGTLG
jgi:8-oxo-dGTP pyrophosphatase MutT (NUDIX family)